MNHRLPIFAAILSSLLAACGEAPPSGGSDEGALRAPSSDSPHKSTWGYAAPLPLAGARDHASYPRALPLSGVGVVKVDTAPFRATAMYLGVFAGEHLFAFSEHVGLGRTPRAVELGHLDGEKFEVPLEQKPLFTSVAGDVAVHRAVAALPAPVVARLRNVTPVRWSFEPLDGLIAAHPRAKFFVAGRAIYSGAMKEVQARPEIYGDLAKQLWVAAQAEADANKDDRADEASRAGDVFAIAPLEIVAKGTVAPLRDPDGLTLGDGVAAPFLASRPDWSPVSMAATYRSIGRMSGSPIVLVDDDVAVAVGVHWTKGVAEDLRPIMPLVAATPERAFGRVVVRTGSDGTPKLALEQTAPFAYASSLARAGEDMREALSRPGTADTAPLRALFTAAMRPTR